MRSAFNRSIRDLYPIELIFSKKFSFTGEDNEKNPRLSVTVPSTKEESADSNKTTFAQLKGCKVDHPKLFRSDAEPLRNPEINSK